LDDEDTVGEIPTLERRFARARWIGAADPCHEVSTLYDVKQVARRNRRLQGRALAARAADGRLWFVSGTTIVMIDPATCQASDPWRRIDAVSTDGRRIAAAQSLRLPAS
jgi:hypothetical protein